MSRTSNGGIQLAIFLTRTSQRWRPGCRERCGNCSWGCTGALPGRQVPGPRRGRPAHPRGHADPHPSGHRLPGLSTPHQGRHQAEPRPPRADRGGRGDEHGMNLHGWVVEEAPGSCSVVPCTHGSAHAAAHAPRSRPQLGAGHSVKICCKIDCHANRGLRDPHDSAVPPGAQCNRLASCNRS